MPKKAEQIAGVATICSTTMLCFLAILHLAACFKDDNALALKVFTTNQVLGASAYGYQGPVSHHAALAAYAKPLPKTQGCKMMLL